MKNSPIGCRFTRKIPSLGDEKFLLGHNSVIENSSVPPGAGPDKYRLDLIIAGSESLSLHPFLTLRDMKANID